MTLSVALDSPFDIFVPSTVVLYLSLVLHFHQLMYFIQNLRLVACTSQNNVVTLNTSRLQTVNLSTSLQSYIK